ncbi:hypothetical protein HNP46_004259 [Pseudomonas nitritireducens]|uniref:PcfJ-like protein n=1 Tax=Pseudomonas nitroreducens TaxID=46680 RepID=A0A7W7KN66_PSENT|nr:PcfJ domain-containing protein [Pseudomonas nitritireducens]MBB4865378.1 hypothetical protein [Pseudomonas nitritireducens]
MFGHPELEQFYWDIKRRLIEHKIFRICTVEEIPNKGLTRIIICSLWRIDRLTDGSVKLYTYSTTSKKWSRDNRLEAWPNVPLWPVQATQSLSWWEHLLSKAIEVVMKQNGYEALCKKREHRDTAFLVEKSLLKFYLPRQVRKRTKKPGGQTKYVRRDGFITSASGNSGARALRASFYDHIRETELFSAAMAIHPRMGTLKMYLRYALQAEHVKRIARENRNLLPIMARVGEKYWQQQDLFSRHNWVLRPGETILAQRRGFTELNASFLTPAGWKWVCRSSITVVEALTKQDMGRGMKIDLIEALAHANITVKVPALVWYKVINLGSRIRNIDQNRVATSRFLKAFVTEAHRVWKTDGFNQLKTWLKNRAHHGLIDWLNFEGFALGFPGKHDGMASFNRHSVDWHHRMTLKRLEGSENLKWESDLAECVIDGYTCRPLTNHAALSKEGYEQSHCVVSYVYLCADDLYRVFSIISPGGERTTLGLELHGDPALWSVQQHQGYSNEAIPEAAEAIGDKLATLYSEAYLKRLGKRKRR